MNYIEHNTLKKKLCDILDYWKIPYTYEEINSYTISELTQLVSRFEIKLTNADKKDNMWYTTSIL